MIDYCYHSHTERCGHAKGKDEEFVLAAIKLGIKVLGFTDHIFLPGFHQPGMRGDFSLLDDYLDSIHYLKEKYKDKIEIHAGFEAEYLPNYLDYYRWLLDSKRIEYLIIGQHSNFDENGKMVFYGDIKDPEKRILAYTEDLVKGIETGLFTYVAHPDFICWMYGKKDALYENCMRRIIEAALKHDMPVELNLGGFRKKLDREHAYGEDDFLRIVSEYKDAKVIVGFDAHNPRDYNLDELNHAEALIKKYNINIVSRIKL